MSQPAPRPDHEGPATEMQDAASDLTAAIVRLLRAIDGERALAQQPAQLPPVAPPDDGCLAYTVNVAARLLGVSAARLTEQIRAGRLPAVKLGRRWLVSRVELERWLARDASGQGDVYGPIPEMALHDRRRKRR